MPISSICFRFSIMLMPYFSRYLLSRFCQAFTWEGRAGVITVFSGAFCAETQSTCLAAFGVWRLTTIAFILISEISNAKPTIHTTWCYLRYLDSRLSIGVLWLVYLLSEGLMAKPNSNFQVLTLRDALSPELLELILPPGISMGGLK